MSCYFFNSLLTLSWEKCHFSLECTFCSLTYTRLYCIWSCRCRRTQFTFSFQSLSYLFMYLYILNILFVFYYIPRLVLLCHQSRISHWVHIGWFFFSSTLHSAIARAFSILRLPLSLYILHWFCLVPLIYLKIIFYRKYIQYITQLHSSSFFSALLLFPYSLIYFLRRLFLSYFIPTTPVLLWMENKRGFFYLIKIVIPSSCTTQKHRCPLFSRPTQLSRIFSLSLHHPYNSSHLNPKKALVGSCRCYRYSTIEKERQGWTVERFWRHTTNLEWKLKKKRKFKLLSWLSLSTSLYVLHGNGQQRGWGRKKTFSTIERAETFFVVAVYKVRDTLLCTIFTSSR